VLPHSFPLGAALLSDLGESRTLSQLLGEAAVPPSARPGRVREELPRLCDLYEAFVREVIAPHVREAGGAEETDPVVYQFPPTVRAQVRGFLLPFALRTSLKTFPSFPFSLYLLLFSFFCLLLSNFVSPSLSFPSLFIAVRPEILRRGRGTSERGREEGATRTVALRR